MKNFTLTMIVFFALLGGANAQNWNTNFETAKATAKAQNKPIILVFQGSDWCAPCIKLDKEIWSSETFKAYADKNYIMMKADFPKRKANALPEDQQKQNNQLAEKYNLNGYFPFVVILDANGKKLGETGYKKIAPQEYIDLINKFTTKK